MGIKSFNPYTPSRRHMTSSDFNEITKSTPEKSLVVSLKKNAGRNNQGKITVRHRGGGSRRKYRIIDFKRRKDDVPAIVKSIEYDPNRTANIALICYADGEKAYILAPEGLKVGMKVMSGAAAEVRPGNCLPLSEIPVGTMVHNVELHAGKGGQLVRSAWVEDGSDKYFVNSSGAKITNDWRLTAPYDDDSAEEQWYYFKSNGKRAEDEKITYKGKTYFFDSEGEMLTGWVQKSGDGWDEASTADVKGTETYYCDETGVR